MTQYRVSNEPSAVSIELTGVGGHQKEVLEAFQECQEGACSCPTDEYLNVASMTVDADESRIAIRLEAKPGREVGRLEDRKLLGVHDRWGGTGALTSSFGVSNQQIRSHTLQPEQCGVYLITCLLAT